MFKAEYLVVITGLFMLTLSIVNFGLSTELTQPFLRSEVIASLSSILIVLIGLIWWDIKPKQSNKVTLKGKEGLYLYKSISEELKEELLWGTEMLLTATAASCVLVYFKEKIIIQRGIVNECDFQPGPICLKASANGELISLVNTTFYPASSEFDTIVPNLPSVLIKSLGKESYLIIGGWSIRCFTKSDEVWVNGWSSRLCKKLHI